MARSSAAHLARRATGVASFAVGRQQGNAACARCAKLRTIAPPSASVRHGQEAIGSGVGRFRECAGLGMSVRSKRQRETRMRSRTRTHLAINPSLNLLPTLTLNSYVHLAL